MFPELQSNDFFVSGESYAGKYIPAISYAIHQRNPTASVKINLQGILIGNGLSDPINQFNYGDFLYQLGLIDLPTLNNNFNVGEAAIIDAINKEQYYDATDLWNEVVGGISIYSGLDNIYNFIKDIDDSPTAWEDFIVQDDVRQALHVGSQSYSTENYDVYNALYADITKSVAPWVIELLNHYRVLIFNGQLDIIVNYSLTANYLQKLNFSAAEEYKTAERGIWYVNDRVAGYAKTAGNLTEVMVRDAGHMVPSDQPEFAYDLISNFIRNKPLTRD
jgi:vitellogenic carboxypeptidase-like protein